MSDFEQKPYQPTRFLCADFADNPEPRCPCLLLLDTSTSMSGRAIAELNEGLISFKQELAADTLASRRVEVAVVSFGPVSLVSGYETADNFNPPTLIANGDTPLGRAVEFAIDLTQERKSLYRANGIAYYRPWIFLITDGAPTDAWDVAAAKVREGERAKNFMFFSVGVCGADFGVLRQLGVREPLRLEGLKFRELFSWLSSSLSSVSQSQTDDQVRLANPAAPGGWAVVG